VADSNYRYRGGRVPSPDRYRPVDVDMGIGRHLYDSPRTLVAKGLLVVIPTWDLREVSGV
jgi:hypothetical protein